MKESLIVTASTFPRWKGDSTPPFVYGLSTRLASKFDIKVLIPHSKDTELNESMGGIEIVRYRYFLERYEKLCERAILPSLRRNPLLWFQVPFFLITQLFALKKIIKSTGARKIHAHWIIPQGFVAVLYKLFFDKNISILITTHGGDIFGLRTKPFLLLKRWILNHIDSLTVVSKAIHREILDLGIRENLPIEVIPMGVDLEKFNSTRTNPAIRSRYNINGPFLLFVGRLSEKKGVHYLIEAMPEIVKQFPETKLLIIGDGELKSELERLANSLELKDKHIIFTGAIANRQLPEYYATADIFIGPSVVAKGGDREGLPVTYMEAMASGALVIGTDLPGNLDLLIDRENGLIIKQADSKDIISTVKFALSNKESIMEIIERSVATINDKFSWGIIAEKYSRIIASL